MSSLSDDKKQQCAWCSRDDTKLLNCSACHSVSYCSRACQAAHWAGHKAACKLLCSKEKEKEKDKGSGVGDMRSLSTALSSVERYSEVDIYKACFLGEHDELQKVLKQHGLDINLADPDTGATAVFVAALGGHDKCLSMAIQYGGADLTKKNKIGLAPIHAACAKGRISCLTIFLDHGVDANLRAADNYGFTPVICCCIAGHVKCLGLLLDRGADPNLADSDKFTPAHWACFTGQLKCLQLLNSKGANLNAKDGNGETPLDWARQYGHTVCVELLLENNAAGKNVEDIPPVSEADKVRLRCN